MLNKISTVLSNPTYNAAFTTINLLLGTGPIIIPEPFYEAGIILAFIWMMVILLVSYNSARYIGQSIQLVNQYRRGTSLIDSTEHSQIQDQNSLTGVQEQKPLIAEHIQLFKYLYGQKFKYLPGISISIYLFGVSISKCIMTGKTLSQLLSNVPVLQTFYFWLGVFFVAGAAFSFKSIDKTKIMQIIIIAVRAISIGLMIVGAFIIMGQNGTVQPLTSENGPFNFQYFPDIFSNLVFSFLFHHSLPGIAKQVTSSKQVFRFLKIAFVIAGTVMIIIPITAIMAFGQDLVKTNTKLLTESHSLRFYSLDFKDRINFIYYFVSFYVFLNVAAFSVYIIVIRTNLFKLFKPEIDPNIISKSTLITSGTLLALILAVSFALKDQIQIALSFTGGIFGCIILFFLPALEVYKARKLTPPKPSFLNSYVWMPIAIMIFGGICTVFNLYQIIAALIK